MEAIWACYAVNTEICQRLRYRDQLQIELQWYTELCKYMKIKNVRLSSEVVTDLVNTVRQTGIKIGLSSINTACQWQQFGDPASAIATKKVSISENKQTEKHIWEELRSNCLSHHLLHC